MNGGRMVEGQVFKYEQNVRIGGFGREDGWRQPNPLCPPPTNNTHTRKEKDYHFCLVSAEVCWWQSFQCTHSNVTKVDRNKLIVLETLSQMSTGWPSKRKSKNQTSILSPLSAICWCCKDADKLSSQANNFSVLQFQIESTCLSAMSDPQIKPPCPHK